MLTVSIRIRPADDPELLRHARTLLLEYAASLGFDLCFQDFATELAYLADQYGPPSGTLLLAFGDGDVAGCVGVRRLADGLCEMKRLYVRQAFRGHGVGRALAVGAVESARQAGYGTMRLDTVPAMTEAVALYRSLGFVEIAPYRHNPVEGAVFMELDLTRRAEAM